MEEAEERYFIALARVLSLLETKTALGKEKEDSQIRKLSSLYKRKESTVGKATQSEIKLLKVSYIFID